MYNAFYVHQRIALLRIETNKSCHKHKREHVERIDKFKRQHVIHSGILSLLHPNKTCPITTSIIAKSFIISIYSILLFSIVIKINVPHICSVICYLPPISYSQDLSNHSPVSHVSADSVGEIFLQTLNSYHH